MATVTLASLEAVRSELVNSKYYLNIRSGYMAPVTLHCSYGDSGETITFYIFDGGQVFDLAGSTVSLHGTRSDGANFGPFSCTVSGNSVSFQLQSSMTAVEGGGIAEFTITKSGTTIGTCNFGILVENATFPNGVAYDTDPSVYQDILKYVQRSINSLNYSITEVNTRINTIVAQAGDDNTEIVDARVAYDGTVYATLGEHVRTVDTDFNNRINNSINKITHGLNAFSYQILNSDASNGAPIGNIGDTISFGTQDYYQHGFYAVIPGKHYSVTTRCNARNDVHVYHIWWINSNNVILKYELDSAQLGETTSATLVENYDAIAPDEAEWLVVVTYASTYANVVKVYENSFNYSLGIVDKLLGKVSYTEEDIPLTYTAGSVNASTLAKIGSVITFNTLTFWGHSIVYVKPGEIYKFNTSVNKYIGAKAVFIHWLDEGNVIVDAEFVYDGSKNDSSVETRQHLNDYIAFVPKGACKMCVLAMLSESAYTSDNIKLSKIEFNSLSDQVSRIEDVGQSFDNRITEATYPPTGFDNALWLEPEEGGISGDVGSAYSVGTQTYWIHFYIPVYPGERYRLNFQRHNASTTYHVYFIDSSNKIVAREACGADFYTSMVKDYCVTVPENTVLMIVQTYNNLTTYKTEGRVRIAKDSYDYSAGTIRKIIGNPKYEEELLTVVSTTGSCKGSIGSVPVYDTLTYWSHVTIQVNPGEIYKVNTRVNRTVGTSVWMIYWLDAEGEIIAKDIPVDIGGRGNNTYDTVVRYIKDYLVMVPVGAKQLVINCEYSDFNSYASIYKSKVISLQDQFNQLNDTYLPEYYFQNNYWPGILSTINTKNESILNGVSFVFITDIHFSSYNDEVSKYMVRSVLENSTVPFCLCGGDFPAAYGSEDDLRTAANALKEYEKVIGKDRFFVVRGNHDFTIKTDSSQTTGAEGTGVTMGMNFTYDAIARNQEPYYYGSDPTNLAWYIDIPAQKTRFVGLNSCDKENVQDTISWNVSYRVRREQIDWLLNEALSKEGYRYIFISHIPADSTLSSHSDTQYVLHEIFVALKNKSVLNYTDTVNTGVGTVTHDFTSTTSTAICHIAGHAHVDESNTDRNFLSITTTCDACYSDDGNGAVKGTITAHAFDVFFVNYDTGTIQTVRCGRGSDRSWTY